MLAFYPGISHVHGYRAAGKWLKTTLFQDKLRINLMLFNLKASCGRMVELILLLKLHPFIHINSGCPGTQPGKADSNAKFFLLGYSIEFHTRMVILYNEPKAGSPCPVLQSGWEWGQGWGGLLPSFLVAKGEGKCYFCLGVRGRNSYFIQFVPGTMDANRISEGHLLNCFLSHFVPLFYERLNYYSRCHQWNRMLTVPS